jgi:hypothetical protein
MLAFLPAPIRGALALLLFMLNTLFWCTPFYGVLLIKLAIPHRGWQAWLNCGAAIQRWLRQIWAEKDALIEKLLSSARPTHRDIGPNGR